VDDVDICDSDFLGEGKEDVPPTRMLAPSAEVLTPSAGPWRRRRGGSKVEAMPALQRYSCI
jgi:hypothetical protein